MEQTESKILKNKHITPLCLPTNEKQTLSESSVSSSLFERRRSASSIKATHLSLDTANVNQNNIEILPQGSDKRDYKHPTAYTYYNTQNYSATPLIDTSIDSYFFSSVSGNKEPSTLANGVNYNLSSNGKNRSSDQEPGSITRRLIRAHSAMLQKKDSDLSKCSIEHVLKKPIFQLDSIKSSLLPFKKKSSSKTQQDRNQIGITADNDFTAESKENISESLLKKPFDIHDPASQNEVLGVDTNAQSIKHDSLMTDYTHEYGENKQNAVITNENPVAGIDLVKEVTTKNVDKNALESEEYCKNFTGVLNITLSTQSSARPCFPSLSEFSLPHAQRLASRSRLIPRISDDKITKGLIKRPHYSSALFETETSQIDSLFSKYFNYDLRKNFDVGTWISPRRQQLQSRKMRTHPLTNKERDKVSKRHMLVIRCQGLTYRSNYQNPYHKYKPINQTKLCICHDRTDLETSYEKTIESITYVGSQETRNQQKLETRLFTERSEFSKSEPLKTVISPKLGSFKRAAYKLLDMYILKPIPVSLNGDVIITKKVFRRSRNAVNSYKPGQLKNTSATFEELKRYKQSQEQECFDQIHRENNRIIDSIWATELSKDFVQTLLDQPISNFIQNSLKTFTVRGLADYAKTIGQYYFKMTQEFFGYERELQQLQHDLAETHQLRILLLDVKLQYDIEASNIDRYHQDISTGTLSFAGVVATYFQCLKELSLSHEVDLKTLENAILTEFVLADNYENDKAKKEDLLLNLDPNDRDNVGLRCLLETVRKGREIYESIQKVDRYFFNDRFTGSDVVQSLKYSPTIDKPLLYRFALSTRLSHRLGKDYGKRLIIAGLNKINEINENIHRSKILFESLRKTREDIINYCFDVSDSESCKR